jgi:hypothetical protein
MPYAPQEVKGPDDEDAKYRRIIGRYMFHFHLMSTRLNLQEKIFESAKDTKIYNDELDFLQMKFIFFLEK